MLVETVIYNADSDHGSGTSLVLWVDGTVCYLSKEHLPFAIAAHITLIFISLPQILLIFYPCKVYKRGPNGCHRRKWHALHTVVDAYFMGAAKMELLEDEISIHVGDLHALLFDSCH